MQIYRGMPVLTRAPAGETVRAVAHHLTGVVSPREEYSAAKFAANAEKTIKIYEEVIRASY
jgi:tRNA A37 N6-isopentenylltransferase MiaA